MFSLWKRIKCFPSTPPRRHLKTHQSPVILDLPLFVFEEISGREITWSWRHCFRKALFPKCFSFTLKQIRFHDGLVWTVGLTIEIKLRFQSSPAYPGRGVLSTSWVAPTETGSFVPPIPSMFREAKLRGTLRSRGNKTHFFRAEPVIKSLLHLPQK